MYLEPSLKFQNLLEFLESHEQSLRSLISKFHIFLGKKCEINENCQNPFKGLSQTIPKNGGKKPFFFPLQRARSRNLERAMCSDSEGFLSIQKANGFCDLLYATVTFTVYYRQHSNRFFQNWILIRIRCIFINLTDGT